MDFNVIAGYDPSGDPGGRFPTDHRAGRDTTPQVPQTNLKLELFSSDHYKQPDHFLLVSQPEGCLFRGPRG